MGQFQRLDALRPHRGLYHPNWIRISKTIRGRDECECKICGMSSRAGVLQVHHIDSDPANNKSLNLVTLCSDCHRGVHQAVYRPCDHEDWPAPWGELEDLDSDPEYIVLVGLEDPDCIADGGKAHEYIKSVNKVRRLQAKHRPKKPKKAKVKEPEKRVDNSVYVRWDKLSPVENKPTPRVVPQERASTYWEDYEQNKRNTAY